MCKSQRKETYYGLDIEDIAVNKYMRFLNKQETNAPGSEGMHK